MPQKLLSVCRVDEDDKEATNRCFLNPADFPKSSRHIQVTSDARKLLFTAEADNAVSSGQIAFSFLQRKWGNFSFNQAVPVEECPKNEKDMVILSIGVEVDFRPKTRKMTTKDTFNTEEMSAEFLRKSNGQVFSVGQPLSFTLKGIKLVCTVKEIQLISPESLQSDNAGAPIPSSCGMLVANSTITFEKGPSSSIVLVGKARGKIPSIINPDWNFGQLGIGGLDNEFNTIFRRAFQSRLLQPEVIEQLGCKHVKGILLFGPPGTGKTLIARQIGKMLNAREPKIVNGPQILDKYVGESEANIRRLFADAEEEQRTAGVNSGLHIIIFDEIDAICKARGSVSGASGVHDTVVNQLLSKIDGLDQLNNILVIGMTNRKDMIDEALLRPGRFEVQMEIGLPNDAGRVQILNIHTANLRKNNKLALDVNIEELASLTKNFSGAELEGLVRAAGSSALNRHITVSNKVEVDPDVASKLCLTRKDFLYALENDIKPAFGPTSELLDQYQCRGITIWGDHVRHIIDQGKLLINQARSPSAAGLVTVLLEGAPNAGKTALAAHIAKVSDFPFIKVCSSEEMVGFSETAKCLSIKKYFDDAYRSPLSCILVDNIERLLDYGPIGPRYSNLTLQVLLVLLKKEPPKGRKLLVICTSSTRSILEELGMVSAFTTILHVPNIRQVDEIVNVLENSDVFSNDDINQIKKEIGQRRLSVGIKKLLGLLDLVDQAELKDRPRKFINILQEQVILEKAQG